MTINWTLRKPVIYLVSGCRHCLRPDSVTVVAGGSYRTDAPWRDFFAIFRAQYISHCNSSRWWMTSPSSTISWMIISTWPPCTHPIALKAKEMCWKATIHWRTAATINNHTNDAIEDEMTTMTFASSFLSTPSPSPSNNNHTNATMEDALTATTHSSTSRFDPTQMRFDTYIAVEPPAKASFSSSSLSNPLPSHDSHTNDTMEDAMT